MTAEISALSISRDRYQTDINALWMIHTLMACFQVWNARKGLHQVMPAVLECQPQSSIHRGRVRNLVG